MEYKCLIIIIFMLSSCNFSLENENDLKEHEQFEKEWEAKMKDSTLMSPDSVFIPDTFIMVEPSINPLFINALNKQIKEEEWEASITGIVLTSKDWAEDIDPKTREIKGRIRTAAVIFMGEEGVCSVFEKYEIYQDYQNGSYVGEPRPYFHSESKEVDCEKYKHLMFKKVTRIGYDKKGE
jgi:hypothetical protein